MPASLRSQTVSGALWLTFARVCTHATQVVSLIVLARLLTPGAYGVVAMVGVVIALVNVLRSMGTAPAVIQRAEITPRFVASIFWTNVMLGALAATGGMVLAPSVARLYQEPQVAPVMFWLSLNFFFGGVSAVYEALLTRAMAFRAYAIIEVVTTCIEAVVAIVLATLGYGVWSLVVASICGSFSSMAMQVASSTFRPTLRLAWSEIRSTLSFSLNLSGFGIVNYVGRNADSFLIGRYLGPEQLGPYQFAYNLMLFPVQNIAYQLGRVTFPALAQMQDDDARIRRAYLRSCAVTAAVTFPLMMGLIATASPFIAVLLGAQWVETARIVPVLAAVGLIQSVVVTAAQIYVTKGRTDLLLRTAIITTAVVVPAFVIGLRAGAFGVAVGYAVGYFAVMYFVLVYAFRLIGLRLREFVASLAWCLHYSLIMFGAVVAVRLALDAAGITHPATVLAGAVATGVLVYGGLLALRTPAVIVDLLGSGALAAVPGVTRFAAWRARRTHMG